VNLDAPAVSHYKQADVDPPTALCGASLIGVLAPPAARHAHRRLWEWRHEPARAAA